MCLLITRRASGGVAATSSFFIFSYFVLKVTNSCRELGEFPQAIQTQAAHQRSEIHHVKLPNFDTSTKGSALRTHFLSPVRARVLPLCSAFLFGAVKGLAGSVRCRFPNRNQLSEVKVVAERWHCGRWAAKGRVGGRERKGGGRWWWKW